MSPSPWTTSTRPHGAGMAAGQEEGLVGREKSVKMQSCPPGNGDSLLVLTSKVCIPTLVETPPSRKPAKCHRTLTQGKCCAVLALVGSALFWRTWQLRVGYLRLCAAGLEERVQPPHVKGALPVLRRLQGVARHCMSCPWSWVLHAAGRQERIIPFLPFRWRSGPRWAWAGPGRAWHPIRIVPEHPRGEPVHHLQHMLLPWPPRVIFSILCQRHGLATQHLARHADLYGRKGVGHTVQRGVT
jgi:hypothetical protein